MTKPKMITFTSIGTACTYIGIIVTGILSARAGYRYYKKVSEEPCDHKKVAIKEAIPPVIAAAATMTAVGVTTKHYKETITGLGTAVAALSSQVSDINEATREVVGEEKFNEIGEKVDLKRGMRNWQDDSDIIVLDPDGAIWFDELTGLKVRAFSETIKDGFYDINRNYRLRYGLASLYELYTKWGVKKKDLTRLGLDWTRYVGWHSYWLDMFDKGFIDWHSDNDETINVHEQYNCLVYDTCIMPICVDPPENIHYLCHTDDEEVRELLIDREVVDEEIAI